MSKKFQIEIGPRGWRLADGLGPPHAVVATIEVCPIELNNPHGKPNGEQYTCQARQVADGIANGTFVAKPFRQVAATPANTIQQSAHTVAGKGVVSDPDPVAEVVDE